ncbi:MAG: hypothetical protein U1D55_15345 [Phycisphaerae bacterium]
MSECIRQRAAFTGHRPPRRRRVLRCALLTGLLAAMAPGCDSNQGQRSQLRSLYPLDRAKAAVALAEAGERDAIQSLVALLDDSDRGVRLYTIVALERLTGQTHGYLYYADEGQRAAAIERWRQAIRDGQVALRPTSRPAKAAEDAAKTPLGSAELSSR